MIEIDSNPVIGVNISDILIDGNNKNAGGWGWYARANKGGLGVGGFWNATFNSVKLQNFKNVQWWRGTAGDSTQSTSDYSNSLEPHQFVEFVNCQWVRSSNSKGEGMRLTGQVNQFTGSNGLNQQLTSSVSKFGVNIRFDREFLSRESALNSAKVPQYFDINGLSIQQSEYGIIADGGNALNFNKPYFETIDRCLKVTGIASSNRTIMYLNNPQWRGGAGVRSGGGGYLIQANQEASVVSRDNMHLITPDTAWINNGSYGLSITGKSILNGSVAGIPSTYSTTLVQTKALAANSLNVYQAGVTYCSAVTRLENINSDTPVGESLLVVASNANGLILSGDGNIYLPNARSRWRVPPSTMLRFTRVDNGAKAYLAEIVTPIRLCYNRSGPFNLDALYTYGIVCITATSAVTIPSDTTETSFAIGDEIPVILTATGVLSFVADTGVTIIATKLSVSAIGTRCTLLKTAANTWNIAYSA
jgi:hypothetical protein